MRGGSLTRFRPDDQFGSGLVRDFIGSSVKGGWEGLNCTLFVFENAANGCLNSPVLNPKLSGELRLVLAFGGDQGANVTAIVYGEFENLLEINPVKAVQYDVYQT